jgi:hypothetical protein
MDNFKTNAVGFINGFAFASLLTLLFTGVKYLVEFELQERAKRKEIEAWKQKRLTEIRERKMEAGT